MAIPTALNGRPNCTQRPSQWHSMGSPIALNGHPNCVSWASPPHSIGATILTRWFPINHNSIPSQELDLPYITDRAPILREHGKLICQWASHASLMGNPAALHGYPTCSPWASQRHFMGTTIWSGGSQLVTVASHPKHWASHNH